MAKIKPIKFSDYEKSQLNKLVQSELLSNINPVLIRAMYSRGIHTAEDMHLHLNSALTDLPNVPMRDMSVFNSLIGASLQYKSKIVVVGDYDVDGCCATAVMVKGLRKLKLDVDYVVNNRFKEGYGLKKETVDNVMILYPDVNIIITVDNGISAFEAVHYAKSFGITVIVTDHHSVNGDLPNADAIINPRRVDCMYPNDNVCGAAVAYLTLANFYKSLDIKVSELDYLIPFVALATVCDQMNLVKENRIFVKEGLKIINSSNAPLFFSVLKTLTKIEKVKSDTLGFYFGPMVNASGRVTGSVNSVIDAMITEDKEIANRYVSNMISVNEERREISKKQCEIAELHVDKMKDDEGELPKVLVVYDYRFTEGIIGIIAGNLCEKYNRPCLVLCNTEDEDILKGSARSIPSLNIVGAFNSISSIFVGYGGHSGAAGFSINLCDLEKLNEDINCLLKWIDVSTLEKVIEVDAVISPRNVNVEFYNTMELLEPFGNGYNEPQFYLKGFKVDMLKSSSNKANSPYVGSDGNTLRLLDLSSLVLMMFKGSQRYKSLGEPLTIDAVGKVSKNEYMGNVSAQFMVLDNYLFKAKE